MSYVNKDCDVTTLAIQRGRATREICRWGRGDFRERELGVGRRVICEGGGATLEERGGATRHKCGGR